MNIPKPIAYTLFVLPWLAAILACVWLVVVRFPPSGILTVQTQLDGKSPWINPFLPAERASTPGKQPDGWVGQRITDDPVYLTALVPGPYGTVDVDLEYKPVRQTLMDFGMVHDAAGTQLELKPLYSSELDNTTWIQTSSQGQTGYVRETRAAARLSNPDPQGLAVWDVTGTYPALRDPNGPEKAYDVSLRGAHDFYFVPTDELKVTFMLQAVNRNPDSGLVAFRVLCGDQEVSQEAFDIAGSRDTAMGTKQAHTVSVAHAGTCIYHIAFTASDDVFIRGIQTSSQHWVVGPRLVFGDVVGYATSSYPGQAWTNSRHIVAETFHKEGLQKISFGPVQKTLVRTHSTLPFDRQDDGQIVPLFAPQGDVRFVGDGYFALSKDAFFEPKPRRFTASTILDTEKIDAVLTDYVRPDALADGWLHSHFTFSVDPTLDHLRFVLSAPGIMTRTAAVDVRKMTLTYRRPAVSYKDWFAILRQELANAWHRL